MPALSRRAALTALVTGAAGLAAAASGRTSAASTSLGVLRFDPPTGLPAVDPVDFGGRWQWSAADGPERAPTLAVLARGDLAPADPQ